MTLPLLLALASPASAQPAPAPAAAPAPSPDAQQDALLAGLREEIEAHQQDLAAQEEALAEAQRKLAEQQAALEALQQQVTETRLKLIPPEELKVAFEGHYRVRGHVYNHFWASQTGPRGAYQDARYLDQRLWLRPRFEWKDLAKLWIELRALEGVVAGDNMSLNSTALFAGEPSQNGLDGLPAAPVTFGRAWMEFKVPVGLMRVGRMPSEWGMGLLVAPGDKFDQRFGESKYPTTNDRVLFATRPIAILDTVTGREDRGIPFVVAVAVDRLVEDPLYQYYGYRCEPGTPEADPDFDPRCDSNGDGVTDLDHSYQDDTRVPQSRSPDWWADQADDVWQMVYVVTYRGEDIDYLGGTGDLTVGAWVVNRVQQETDSNALIVDGYFKSFVHRVLLEGELVSITGGTRAIVLPDSTAPDPLQKQANVLGYAARAAWVDPGFKVQFETGFASGDDNVTDGDFTGRPLNPDFNVGLLLYEDVIAQVTAAVRTTGARGLWSQGGVYSSRYVFPTVHLYPLENWEILAGGVAAWPDRPDGAVIRCKSSDAVDCTTPASLQPEAEMLGWELDLGLHLTFHEHLKFALEGAYAKATDRLPLEAAGLNPEGKFFTVQSRIAWVF